MALRPECIHFRGDKPCAFKRLCKGCPHFEPFPTKILILKCRAQGDVLRTTPLLSALKRKYSLSYISWLVDPESTPLLLHNSLIDRLYPYDLENVLTLLAGQFDVLISLDKEPGLTSLATMIKARQKFGFGMNDVGNLTVFNPASDYAYRLGVDDDLKFLRNQKTYQEIICDIAEVPYLRDEYIFNLPDEARVKADSFFKRHRIFSRKPAVGLNTGAGTKFETKQWPAEHFLKLIPRLTREMRASVFLLGGPREKDMNLYLARKTRAKVYNTGNDNSLLEFAGFMSRMDLLVCSDTLAMHLAIGLRKKVVALFGPTCPQEIDLYGRGVKLFSGARCAPCYKQTCADAKCMREITPDGVFQEIRKII